MQGICECDVSIAAGSWARAEIGGHRTRAVGAALRVPLGRFHITTFSQPGAINKVSNRSIPSVYNLGPILLVAGLFSAVGLTTLYITTLKHNQTKQNNNKTNQKYHPKNQNP